MPEKKTLERARRDKRQGKSANTQAGEFVKEQYRHCKPILALGASSSLLEGSGASRKLPDGSDDPGIVLTGSHIDSVSGGGAYDGALGVVMAICAVGWLAT
jgi:Zn-dependent M28 family amino/carboxypeptidase